MGRAAAVETTIIVVSLIGWQKARPRAFAAVAAGVVVSAAD
jgi:hypothetical protein